MVMRKFDCINTCHEILGDTTKERPNIKVSLNHIYIDRMKLEDVNIAPYFNIAIHLFVGKL